jgi:thymidine kinase
MPKLYFRYGAMSSSKTANLLMVAHNYEIQNKKILIIKPQIDVRFGNNLIKSRAGLEKPADIVLSQDENIFDKNIDFSEYNAILVDEVQFLTEKQIEDLRYLTKYLPVICYGLRTDYRLKLFPASKRLLELADSIEEVKTTCHFCNKKAIINLKFNNVNGSIIKDGNDEVDLGAEDKYLGSCWFCWCSREKI